MKTNSIIDEIRATRERLLAEAGNDLNGLFGMAREWERAAKARGVKFVAPPKQKATVVREDPPPYVTPGEEPVP